MTVRDLVYVEGPIHPEAMALLEEHGDVALGFGPHAVPVTEVCDRVAGILMRTGRLDADVIANAPHLRVIARHGVGLDSIDVEAATRAGVLVLITSQANAASVAEHTVGLLIAAARRYRETTTVVSEGEFGRRDQLVGTQLAGRTLAVVGYGRIGRRVGAVAEALQMDVRVHDPYLPSEALPTAHERLETALDAADALTVHVPLTPQTSSLVGARELDLLAPAAIVVNTARGGVVDEAALAERLRDGRLSAAGVDVFATEPPVHSPLLGLDNVILTPHIAAHTAEAIRRMSIDAAHNITRVLGGDEPAAEVTAVNRG
ncbi:MAG: hydroxyacid dehydrogenase [Streptosporangiales bacterium]|nr:hydroxyacid dehydrogenase [Streptosporangiales bacterium]